MVFGGIALILVGAALAGWWNHVLKAQPTSSDLPVFLAAALIAGGIMMTFVSAIMYFVGGDSRSL